MRQKPKDVLSEKDYRNYRNIRAVSVLFVVLGLILVLGGTVSLLATPQNRPPQDALPGAFAVILCLVGLSGAIGGIAALFGNRKLAWLVYVMAALYLFAFPMGTILSIVMLTGLKRYLASRDELLQSPADQF